MRLPDFIVIGAAKAGTTSLYRTLARHPDVFMPTPKEPEFFARDDRYAEGIASYAALFDAAAPGQICGEASTLYSLSPFFPETAARIARHLPRVRLVYMMREPVARSYSYYLQMVKNYQNASGDRAVHRSFEDFVLPDRNPGRAPREKAFGSFSSHLPDDPELFLAGSDYVRQIRAYLQHFDRDRMHFLTLEDYRERPGDELARLCAFLGLDPAGFPADTVRANVSADHFETVAAVQAAARVRDLAGPFHGLARRLPAGLKDGLKRRIARATAKRHAPPPMEEATRRTLTARFAADRDELAALTGLDLSAWGAEPA